MHNDVSPKRLALRELKVREQISTEMQRQLGFTQTTRLERTESYVPPRNNEGFLVVSPKRLALRELKAGVFSK